MTDTPALTLDRSKHHSIVTPPEKGAHFEQNGFYFDYKGDLAEEWLTDATRERLRKIINKKEADKIARAARQKFMQEQGLSEADLAADADDQADAAAGDDEVDIVAWAKGTKKYRFFSVVAAVSKRYNFEGTDRHSIIEFLIERGVVSEQAVAH